MKRVVVSGVILLLIVGLCIGTQLFLINTKEKAVSMVETAYDSVNRGDLRTARIQVLEFTEYWDEKEKLLTVFVRHGQIEELSVLAASLEPMLASGNITDYYAANARVLKLLELITESERPAYSTVF